MFKDLNNEDILMCVLAFVLGFFVSKMMRGNSLTESFILDSDQGVSNLGNTLGCGKCAGACRCGNNTNTGCKNCLAGKSGCNFY